MRYLIALSALAATIALAAAGTAGAGGWATVGFTPLPDDTTAGGTWNPKITILQHGVTPLEGLHPTVTIDDVDTGASQQFTAVETSQAGIYEADVVFPTDGRWRVTIDSTFGDSHRHVRAGPDRRSSRPGRPAGSSPCGRARLSRARFALGGRRWRSASCDSGG